MRARSIIWFERVALLAYGLGILDVVLEWDAMIARAHSPYPVPVLFLSQFLYFGSYALLIWLIGRKGSVVARGIYGAVVVTVGLVYLATLPAVSDMSVATVSGAAQCLLTLASLALIFGRDAEGWFSGNRVPIDPDIFS
jgi:hypothetical protein